MKEIIFNLMSKISGQAYNPAWEGKVFSLLSAGVSLLIFLCLFGYLFYRYVWRDLPARKWGIITASALGVIVISKFILSRLWVGYIPDRLLFFAIPSPKIENPLWLVLALLIFVIFLLFRKNIQKLKKRNFLIIIFLTFFAFTTAVAGIRQGRASIADPMTRIYWEATGNIQFIENTHDFLRDYIVLQPKLAVHATNHPPGYSLLAYYFSKIVGMSFLGISLLIILTAGFSVFPIYYLLKKFFDEDVVRKLIQVYIFIPSIVIMAGTSFEAFFVTIVWTAITLLFIGWNKSWWLSALGGITAGIAFFSNYLFLLLAPFLLVLVVYLWKKFDKINRNKLILRVFISFLSFVLFFVSLWLWSGYSIIENFFISHAANSELVISNFDSILIYFTFFVMNILAFGIALGIANINLFINNKKEIFIKSKPELWIGFVFILYLCLIGVFQGELTRLWMFVVPFFLFPLSIIVKKISNRQFNTLLSLLFLQIVVIQILFYTYW
ncbi:MAG: hypothetical protein Q8P20_03960 [bacterium]|nr:hypothetical protein [bacterium]